MRTYSPLLAAIVLQLGSTASAQQPASSIGFILEDTSPPAGILQTADQRRLLELEGRRSHEIGCHVEIAEYMDLRRQAFGGNLPSARSDIIHYARKNLGIPYKRGAYMLDLQHADCVTWTERVLSEALTDNWKDGFRLVVRLRHRDGLSGLANRNHYPLADWLPNNAWLVQDITSSLGVDTVNLDVLTDRRRRFLHHATSAGQTDISQAGILPGPELSLTTAYIPKAKLKAALLRLRSGDLAFFIADYPDLVEGASRPRCIHQGIIHRDQGRVKIFHSIHPEATESLLLRFVQSEIPRDRFLGMKFARIRPNARQLVATELANRNITALLPSDVDDQFNVRGMGDNGVRLVRAARAPDEEVTIGPLVFGAVDLAPRETLYSLFRRQWEYVYELDVNASFRSAYPDPNNVSVGARILYPLRPARRTQP